MIFFKGYCYLAIATRPEFGTLDGATLCWHVSHWLSDRKLV